MGGKYRGFGRASPLRSMPIGGSLAGKPAQVARRVSAAKQRRLSGLGSGMAVGKGPPTIMCAKQVVE